jgi:hypothetical protein
MLGSVRGVVSNGHLYRDKSIIPGADAVSKAEGNTAKRDIARLGDPAGSKNLACVEAPWAGTGRSHV